MSDTRQLISVVGLCALLAAIPLAAESGRIEGRLMTPDGVGLSGVNVTVQETSDMTLTDFHGTFGLAVSAGTYTVTFSAAGHSETVDDVEVPFAGAARIDKTLEWDLAATGTTAIFSPSRIGERLFDSPVPAAVVSLREIERQAAGDQIPKLVEFSPGVDIAQNSLYDFSLSTQGFNEPQTSRLAVRIDGRDPSELFFGGQEWAALALPLQNLGQAELLRGPAALYGAAGGVLNLITRRPHESRGGVARIAGGDQSTLNGDLRWALGIGGGWSLELQGSTRSSEDFSVSRTTTAEYATLCAFPGQTDCLPQEQVPLDPDDNEITSGALRIDRSFHRGGLLSVDGGVTTLAGPVKQTELGRVQVLDADWLWARGAYHGDHWRFLGSFKRREADEQIALARNDNFAIEEETWKWEAETFWSLSEDRHDVLVGISYEDERVDSDDPLGRLRPARFNPANQQTLLFEPKQSEAQAVYGEFHWRISPRASVLVGSRYDDSSLYDPKVSPRLALIYAFAPEHTVRLSFNRAFEVPDYSEYFLQADVGDPVNLAELERLCALDGVACGFDIDFQPGEDPALDTTPDTRILAVGNPDLELSQSQTLGVGYSGTFGGNVFLQLDYYQGEHEGILSELLPQLGTSLDRLAPAFPFWEPPFGTSAATTEELLVRLEEELGPLFPFLSNNIDGTPFLAVSSFVNLGDVDTDGADLYLEWRFADAWTVDLGYSWFDYRIASGPADLEERLVPNTPENRASLSLAYASGRWDGAVSVRWVDDFRWAFGPFVGDVDSYTTVDLAANIDVGEHFSIGINAANVLDEEHWQSFGGDVIGRRALGSLAINW